MLYQDLKNTQLNKKTDNFSFTNLLNSSREKKNKEAAGPSEVTTKQNIICNLHKSINEASKNWWNNLAHVIDKYY